MRQSTADNQVKVVGALAQVYADALWDLAAEAGAIDATAAELGQLVDLLDEQPKLRAMFESPAIQAERRRASIASIFKGRLSDLVYRFLQVLNQKSRLGQLPVIRVAFDQRLKAERGEVDVDVYAAAPLTDAQVAAVAEQLGASLGRKAVVTVRVDETMIGGLKLRIGDRLIDGSVATQLSKLKRKMIARGREAVRSNPGGLLEQE